MMGIIAKIDKGALQKKTLWPNIQLNKEKTNSKHEITRRPGQYQKLPLNTAA